ncbi:MAG: ceramidase domain-containing protein [Planctomycetota bacterium]
MSRMHLFRFSPLLCLGLAWLMALILVQFLAPIAQDPAFLLFAESGACCGIPHFWNVVTSLAFLWIGGAGLLSLRRDGTLFSLPAETTFFIGILLTGLGSAYFHWNPNNQTLLWDRLPMALGFLALFLALVDDCLQVVIAKRLLPAALLCGAGSVLYWAYSEAKGNGDLRYYAIVQFLPMLLIPVLLLRWPPQQKHPAWLWTMLGLYVLAKIFEYYDHAIAAWLPFDLTGHALKHVVAAAAAYCFLRARPRNLG